MIRSAQKSEGGNTYHTSRFLGALIYQQQGAPFVSFTDTCREIWEMTFQNEVPLKTVVLFVAVLKTAQKDFEKYLF